MVSTSISYFPLVNSIQVKTYLSYELNGKTTSASGLARSGTDSMGCVFEAAVVRDNNLDPGIGKKGIQKGGSKICFWGHLNENI
jgi:hypothetical protein